jgi:hypothetical protein
MATWDDGKRIALALPETGLSTWYGTPTVARRRGIRASAVTAAAAATAFETAEAADPQAAAGTVRLIGLGPLDDGGVGRCAA